MKLLKVTQSKYNSAGQLELTTIGARATFTAEFCGPYGTDARPANGVLVLYNDTEKNGDEFYVGVLNINGKVDPGEHRIFCTDANGTFKFNIWLRADGTALIGISDDPTAYTDFAVKYNELKTGFDQLKADHNATVSLLNSLIALYNLHTHPYLNGVTPAITSVTTNTESGTGSPSTASVDNSKNPHVKFNP